MRWVYSLILLMNMAQASENWSYEEIQADQAQQVSSAMKPVIVAVIDTGIDLDHSGLQKKLWTNPGETGVDSRGRRKENNGIDDDGNGFIDDIHGWNYVGDNADISDRHGHGTHVSGIISRVAPRVQLMILKYYGGEKSDPLRNLILSLKYALQMGAQIINYSGGGYEPSEAEEMVVKEALQKGVLIVAAAGNDGKNINTEGYYPASYNYSNILSVTAINQFHQIPIWGNYGARHVMISAPGEEVLSLLPGGRRGLMSGTSQATAFVTGAAALLQSIRPEKLTPEQLIYHLLQTGTRNENLSGKVKSIYTLNTFRSLVMKGNHESLAGLEIENDDRGDGVLAQGE